jgi:hypothetical protein
LLSLSLQLLQLLLMQMTHPIDIVFITEFDTCTYTVTSITTAPSVASGR